MAAPTLTKHGGGRRAAFCVGGTIGKGVGVYPPAGAAAVHGPREALLSGFDSPVSLLYCNVPGEWVS
jgi:hypothetical protein